MINKSNLILLVSSIILSLFLIEILLRISNLDHVNKLSFQKNDDQKKRYENFIFEKDKKLILSIGDSFTIYKDYSKKNYFSVLEKNINKQQKYQFLNLANAGDDINEYLNTLCFVKNNMEPDILIFGIFLGNDISHIPFKKKKNNSCNLIKENKKGIKNFLKKSILLNITFRTLKYYLPIFKSQVYFSNKERLVTEKIVSYNKIESHEKKLSNKIVKSAQNDTINPYDLFLAIYNPNFYVDLANLNNSQVLDDYKNFKKNLIYLNNSCKDISKNCIFILIPPSTWIDKKYFNYYKELGYKVDEKIIIKNNLINDLEYFLNVNKIMFINPLIALKNHNKYLFIQNDTHLNDYGQKVLGDYLSDNIEFLFDD